MNRSAVNSKYKGCLRESFSRQSARIIAVDLSQPMTAEAATVLTRELEHFFALICCLKTNVRVPYFGLVALSQYNETLIPLQRVCKSTFQRLISAISKLHELLGNCQPRELENAMITTAVTEIIANFTKQKTTVGLSAFLDITVFTCQSKSKINEIASTSLQHIDSTNLKKINFVCVRNEVNNTGIDLMSTQDRDADLTGIYDILTVECDALSIAVYFKHWLHDEGTDKEHLHLFIGDICVKCDTQERVIDPNELPLGSTFYGGIFPSSSSGFSNHSTTKVPLLQFKAKKSIQCTGLCESVVFGYPLVLRSSSCWQMEWEELDKNQNYFHAICKQLFETNCCLILENLTPDYNQHRNYSFGVSPPHGAFVLFPCSRTSLLLKSIASSEILLPMANDGAQGLTNLANSATSEITRELSSLPRESSYNPLLTSSNLIPCLLSGLKRQNSTQNINTVAYKRAKKNY